MNVKVNLALNIAISTIPIICTNTLDSMATYRPISLFVYKILKSQIAVYITIYVAKIVKGLAMG